MFSLSRAAGAGSDALQDILARKFYEQLALAKMAEDKRQADLVSETQRRGQDITMRGQDQVQGRFDTQRGDMLAAGESEAAKEAAAAAELEKFIGGLPEHMRPVVASKAKFGVQVSPEDMVEAPLNREQAQAFKIKGLAQETETRERIQAKYRPPQQTSTRLVQVEGPDGRAMWVPESQAAGMPAAQAARAVTGSERQSLAYYNRAKEADELANKFEEPVAQAGVLSQIQQEFAPNFMQTADQQAYRQAQRAFTEARLRKESGAAIPQGEYENDARTYFAQPGDSPEVREQKRRARQTVLEGLKFSSGRAFDEFHGSQQQGGAAPDAAARAAELLKKYGGG